MFQEMLIEKIRPSGISAHHERRGKSQKRKITYAKCATPERAGIMSQREWAQNQEADLPLRAAATSTTTTFRWDSLGPENTASQMSSRRAGAGGGDEFALGSSESGRRLGGEAAGDGLCGCSGVGAAGAVFCAGAVAGRVLSKRAEPPAAFCAVRFWGFSSPGGV